MKFNHCSWGHLLTDDNIYTPPGRPWARNCRTCSARRMREYRARLAAAR